MPDGAHGTAAVWPNSLQARSAAFDGAPLGLMAFDATLTILAVNARFHDLIGSGHCDPTACPDLPSLLGPSGMLDPPSARLMLDACRAAIEMPGGMEPVVLCPSGTDHCLAVAVAPIDDGAWLAAVDDVTAYRDAATRAIQGLMRDPLTSLGNRQLFAERVTAALSADGGGGAAILLIDLDRFKAVNDTLGHPTGDALLCLVADRLRGMVRGQDLIARLGGDEFALLLRDPGTTETIAGLAQRLVTLLSRPYLIDGHLVNVGASIGVALAGKDGAAYDMLLKNADLALYNAKASGRNTFSFFEPAMDERAHNRRALELDLRHALELDEFENYYQPQVDLATGRLEGFEALARWRHPVRGMVSPADFIPLAEEIGQIGKLGERVLREACRCAAQWPGDLCVAVNVSPHQFADPARLIAAVEQALLESGLPGRRLELEITESVLLRNEASVLETLHRLRKLGVRVAMDDFGTGYSSLSQLQSFPFDKIKIDRSFLAENREARTQDAVICAIARLGECLGMSTVAEGIETAEQLGRVRANGCKSVQGYLLSRPVAQDGVAALIETMMEVAGPRLAGMDRAGMNGAGMNGAGMDGAGAGAMPPA